MITEQELETLRKRFRLCSQEDIDEIKERLRLTIQILQAFLDKPDALTMGISIYEDDRQAFIETYEPVVSATGGHTLKGAKYTDIPFELGKALVTFLEDAEICEYGAGMEYPKLGTLEAIKFELQKRIDKHKRIDRDIEKEMAEYEILLKRIGEDGQETQA